MQEQGNARLLGQAAEQREGIDGDEAGKQALGLEDVEPEGAVLFPQGHADRLYALGRSGSRGGTGEADPMLQHGGVKGKFGFEQQPERLFDLAPGPEGEGPVPEQHGVGGEADAHVVRAFQARRAQPVEQRAQARGHGFGREVRAEHAVQPRHLAAFHAEAAQRARESGPGLEDDETVLGDHGALRSGLHVEGGAAEGVAQAQPDFAVVLEGPEGALRHELLPELFRRDAQDGLNVHAAG